MIGAVQRLLDADTSWWAKFNHASHHLARLRRVCDDYRAKRPFYVLAETTEEPDEVQYRLHYELAIPKDVPLIIGDVLHNLRSALDSLVLGLVERGEARRLTDEEQLACQFPICPDPDSFKNFFDNFKAMRTRLMPPKLRDAFHGVQPFYWTEQAVLLGVVDETRYAEHAEYDPLCTLAKMSNIDKHRRIAVTLLWPECAGWGTDTGLDQRWRPGNGVFTDGAIVGYISGDVHPAPVLEYEFNIGLEDLVPSDPEATAMFGAAEDVVRQSERWRDAVERTMRHLILEMQR
jgi:hypothetical protein